MPLPTAAEKYHPGCSCGPCALCGNENHRYTHPEDWEDNEKEILTKLSGIPLNRWVQHKCNGSGLHHQDMIAQFIDTKEYLHNVMSCHVIVLSQAPDM